MKELIPTQHIGDGLYFSDEGYGVDIAVNDHRNSVAWLDMFDIDAAIEYLQKVKERILNTEL
jgi:hypothetical protein